MEELEKQHIQTNQRKLLELIRSNAGLMAEIEQTGVLDSSELADLNSIRSEYSRTKELLHILKGKSNGYAILLNAITESKQTGAEAILRQLSHQQHPNTTPQTHNPSRLANMSQSKYRLIFGDELTMSQILQRLRHGLIRCLSNKNSNHNIILQLEALLLFDSDSIDPVMNGQYQTEQERMTALFDVIMKLTGDHKILQCLEKLCDLEDLNCASQNIRDAIERKFPGSVQPRN